MAELFRLEVYLTLRGWDDGVEVVCNICHRVLYKRALDVPGPDGPDMLASAAREHRHETPLTSEARR